MMQELPHNFILELPVKQGLILARIPSNSTRKIKKAKFTGSNPLVLPAALCLFNFPLSAFLIILICDPSSFQPNLSSFFIDITIKIICLLFCTYSSFPELKRRAQFTGDGAICRMVFSLGFLFSRLCSPSFYFNHNEACGEDDHLDSNPSYFCKQLDKFLSRHCILQRMLFWGHCGLNNKKIQDYRRQAQQDIHE